MDATEQIFWQAAVVGPAALLALAIILRRGWHRVESLAAAPSRHTGLGMAALGGAMFLAVAGAVVASAGVSAGIIPRATEASAPGEIAAATILSQLLVNGPPAMLLILVTGLAPGGWRAIGLARGPLRRVVLSAATGLALALPLVLGTSLLFVALSAALGHQPPAVGHPMLEVLQKAGQPLEIAAVVVSAAVLAPLLEELIFRGLLQTVLLEAVGEARRRVVILLAALIFALIHVGVPPHVLPALFVLGLVLGWVYERTGSLWPPILIHCGFNAANLALVAIAPQPAG